MPDARNDSSGAQLRSPCGLRAEFNANGSMRRFECDAVSLALFVGNEAEGGPANIYLRDRSQPLAWTALLGPASPTQFSSTPSAFAVCGEGVWRDIRYSIALLLAQSAPVWFWQLRLTNTAAVVRELDLTYAQDLALAPYGAVRMNEFYVSQYIDHAPLSHPQHGIVIASRQNQAADGRYPWSLIGSRRASAGFATDALQFLGLAGRAGDAPVGLLTELPSQRLQHEHSMVVIRDQPLRLEPQSSVDAGFFGLFVPDHREASSDADLQRIDAVLALPEAIPKRAGPMAVGSPAAEPPSAAAAASLFSAAPLLEAVDLDASALRGLFGTQWRQVETDERGAVLSFFHERDRHVVLRAKELRVLRPHGHILRSGRHITPDETGMTSTAWMNGVFHSMLTQGHVSINRVLSSVHSYLNLFRSHGLRAFVEIGGRWCLLQLPSAFEMSTQACRWIYRFEQGEILVRAEACDDPREMLLGLEVSRGGASRFLLSHHVALNDDDGSVAGAALWRSEGESVVLRAAAGSEVGRRFPQGCVRITPVAGARLEKVAGDELLFMDGRSRRQPYLCIVTTAARSVALRYRGELIGEAVPAPLAAASMAELIPAPTLTARAGSELAEPVARLGEIVPWFTHNALVHYLSPRGLEQYSGGGWGTRDVCQGPVEMLLALERLAPLRDLLLRVMAAQNPDGDWPQWFMFFERERGIRAGDSHGDIVFWPLLVLAQYLTASGDDGVLDERVAFFDARGAQSAETGTVWEHAQRALTLIGKRIIPGTTLAAYGHGDWNDALQPADPRLREHLCSAWTVTLHFQMLTSLAQALHSVGRGQQAAGLLAAAAAVRRDFQRLLLVDGVLAGYALFEEGAQVRQLLHPSDGSTGVHYSALAIIQAILEDLLTPQQAQQHLRLIDAHLSGPDGLRLFDRPMPYHGGPQRLFQRAESATFFGREIGLMYMHAHLRYAQALAHMGEAERFFQALCQANPIGIRSVVPTATLRQANCYYSSSDAAFQDRYQASAEYRRVADGGIALDGGWRVYSSGAGISLALILRRFLGLSCEAQALCVDPVMPRSLDGMLVQTTLRGRPIEILYRVDKAGCGVNELTLNDRALAYTHDPNPHRRGAARVVLSAVTELLNDDGNRLLVRLG
jgi:1,2-beta-oligoglucan phosphorylase